MYKFFFSSIIVGVGAWISAIALGDSADKLLGFFDNYNTSEEGSVDGTRDKDGTSIIYDLSFHVVTYMAEFVTISAIWLGSVIFAFVWRDTSS